MESGQKIVKLKKPHSKHNQYTCLPQHVIERFSFEKGKTRGGGTTPPCPCPQILQTVQEERHGRIGWLVQGIPRLARQQARHGKAAGLQKACQQTP